MRKSRIKLKKFQNPSGTEAWRVSGTVNGVQERKNFKTRGEAKEFQQQLEVKLLQGDDNGRFLFTKLSPEELDSAQAAVKLLNEHGSDRSLLFAIEYFLKNHKEVRKEVSVVTACQEYHDARSKEFERGLIKKVTYDGIREIRKFAKSFESDMPICEITAQIIEAYIQGLSNGKPEKKTWNNVRGILNHFFKWSLEEKYISENPVEKVVKYKLNRSRGEAETLSVQQVEDMMGYLETYPGPNKAFPADTRRGMLVSNIAMTLFSGVRPGKKGELSKFEPHRHQNLETGIITVTADIAKTHETRKPFIQPNYALWLKKYPIEDFPLFPEDLGLDTAMRHIREKFKIPYDGLRHTYISMLVGSFRSVKDAALQAGNSESIIKKHYLDLKTVEEADRFWRIIPQGLTLPKLKKSPDVSRFLIDP